MLAFSIGMHVHACLIRSLFLTWSSLSWSINHLVYRALGGKGADYVFIIILLHMVQKEYYDSSTATDQTSFYSITDLT